LAYPLLSSIKLSKYTNSPGNKRQLPNFRIGYIAPVTSKQRFGGAPHWIAADDFGLRVAALDAVPPGLDPDEAATPRQRRHLARRASLYSGRYGHEPLYNYSVAALTGFWDWDLHAALHHVCGAWRRGH
jgi:hypothetical protein